MSETVIHRGKLVPMVLNGVTMEERCKDACEKLGFEPCDHGSWLDCLREQGYRKVYIRQDIIYKIEDEQLDPYGFTLATKNKDHTVDYLISYYNGGAGFDEVLDTAMNRMANAND